MSAPWTKHRSLAGAAAFTFALLFLYWIAGGVLQTAGDEGIYLEGGRRVALGQQPYRDFFALTGPLTFWIEGAMARLGGMNLAVMRLPMVLDCAFLAACVYWFTSRHTNFLYAGGASLAFLAYESRLRLLNVNHRWDSAALATGAIASALEAHRTGRRQLWALAGFLAACAALATPSILLAALPLLWWCGRKRAPVFVAGALLPAGGAALYLQWHQALIPMIRSMRWTSANYTAANRVFYGSVWLGVEAGGLHSGWKYAIASSAELLPAVLPVAAMGGWLWFLRRHKHPVEVGETLPLLLAAAALVFSAWPRWTSAALLHTMALTWSLCALLLYRVTSPRQRFWFCGVVLLVSTASLVSKSIAPLEYLPTESRVGTLRSTVDEGEFLAALERWVQPGDSLFSFPYLPSLYYFLNARNPTRDSFLQPGMMTLADEREAIAELQADPPRWVIYENYPPQAVLSIWPGSDRALIPMESMNDYLRANYRPVDEVAGPWSRVSVMERTAWPPAR